MALDVQITPRQGEISVGESKFFLCEGKLTSWNTDVSTLTKRLLAILNISSKYNANAIFPSSACLMREAEMADHSQ